MKSETGYEITVTPDTYKNYNLAGCSSTNNAIFLSLDPLMEVKAEPEDEYSLDTFLKVKTEPADCNEDHFKEYSLKLALNPPSTLEEGDYESNKEEDSKERVNIYTEKIQLINTDCEHSFSIQQGLEAYVRLNLKDEIHGKDEICFGEDWGVKDEGNNDSYQEIPQSVSKSRESPISSLPTFYNESDELGHFGKANVDKNPFQCTDCGDIFSCNSKLMAHTRAHSGEKAFVCIECRQSFTRNSHLKIHMRTHKGEKPFICSICNKRFSENSNLTVHMRTHTGEKPFNCNICSQRFSQNSSLKNHMRTHTGEKPFVCNICNQRYTQKSNLKSHMRTHTGEKPFVCNICNQKFSRNPHLKIHMRTHIREKSFCM